MSKDPAYLSAVDAIAREIDIKRQLDTMQPGMCSGWPAPIDLTELAKFEPDPPRFIVPDWLPTGYATLLAGHGGIGKSAIALHLACCISLGQPWWGLPVERRRVMYLSCEDRMDVLHWRLHRICTCMGVTLADLAGHLSILDLVGHSAVLWERSPTGATATAAYAELLWRAADNDVLMVDGISDTFGGNENARTDAKQFVNALLNLISPVMGAVILIGHVAKPAASGASTSEGYSGSTGWHNSVRARWYLYPEVQQDDDGGATKTGDLILELQKSNLGKTDQQMRFRWDNDAHLYTGQMIGGRTRADEQSRDRREQDGILCALRAVIEAGDYCPSATTGNRTAYHVLSARSELPEALKSKPARRRFWRHIEALRRMRLISTGSIRRGNGHYTETLEPGEPANTGAAAESPNDEKLHSTTRGAASGYAASPNAAGGIRGGGGANDWPADYGDIRG